MRAVDSILAEQLRSIHGDLIFHWRERDSAWFVSWDHLRNGNPGPNDNLFMVADVDNMPMEPTIAHLHTVDAMLRHGLAPHIFMRMWVTNRDAARQKNHLASKEERQWHVQEQMKFLLKQLRRQGITMPTPNIDRAARRNSYSSPVFSVYWTRNSVS